METEIKETVKKRAIDRPKHKGGAPKKNIKRENHVMVRLTATEHFLIRTKAREAGMRISDWFRAAAKNAVVVARLKPEEIQVLRMLAGIANNLNQLVKMAHTGGLLSLARKCNELLVEIDRALTYLNSDDR